MNTQGIRSYGPGKFDTMLDAYVYDVSLDGGCDDEAGSVDETGMWYGLMRHGHTIFKDHDPFTESLNEAEREMLTGSAGVIVSEDSQGFVRVEYFSDDKALMKAWAEVTDSLTPDEEAN